jgi:hypothetical protein
VHELLKELKLVVPTYNASLFPIEVAQRSKPEFGKPYQAILIREAEGVRIVLGTHEYDDVDKPDVQIERQPNGWVVFLHPLGGGDPCGMVFFHDDGRSYLLKEMSGGSTPSIIVLEPGANVPAFHVPE